MENPSMSPAELNRFARQIAPLLTESQLIEQAKQINLMNNIDFLKIANNLKEQAKKENKILIGFLRNNLIEIQKQITEQEKEKDFYEIKITKLEADDLKVLQYEKQIYSIEKNIEDLNLSLEKTENEIKELEKNI